MDRDKEDVCPFNDGPGYAVVADRGRVDDVGVIALQRKHNDVDTQSCGRDLRNVTHERLRLKVIQILQ